MVSYGPYSSVIHHELAQIKPDVNRFRLASCRQAQAAFLEHLQHRDVVRQNFGDQLLKTRSTSNHNEMPHQCGPDTPPLIPIDYGESHLGFPRLHNNVASTTGDYWAATFIYHRDQGHVADEIDVEEECYFLFGEGAPDAEKSSIKGLGAGAV